MIEIKIETLAETLAAAVDQIGTPPPVQMQLDSTGFGLDNYDFAAAAIVAFGVVHCNWLIQLVPLRSRIEPELFDVVV